MKETMQLCDSSAKRIEKQQCCFLTVVTLLTRSMKLLSIVTKEPSLCHEAFLSR